MARSFVSVWLLFVAVASCRSSYQLARRVEQSLVDRSTYLGGWPLAAVPCPSDASVACDTGIDSQINQQCCPSGNTCFSWPATIPPVCCPSSQNCVGQLQNLPVCANSSWNMYELGSNNYFCCEQGQVGVIPTTGYAGICQAQGQAVPSSLLATLINQVGAATATASSTTLTGTETAGINTTPISSSKATSTSDGVSSVTTSTTSSSGSSSTATSSNDKNSSGGTHLASGAIAGIAIGAGIVIVALILVFWKWCSTRRPSLTQQHPLYDTVPERSIQPSSSPVKEYKVSPVVSAQQVSQQGPRVNEISGEDRYHGRAEMEP